MNPTSKQDVIDASVVAWIVDGKFVTENKKPIEFVKHKFLIDYLHDTHPDIVGKKSSQVGLTVAETLRSIHLASKRGINTIHTLQTNDVIKGFVVPKVDPIIFHNPKIKELLKVDSQNLKQFGDGY